MVFSSSQFAVPVRSELREGDIQWVNCAAELGVRGVTEVRRENRYDQVGGAPRISGSGKRLEEKEFDRGR